MRVSAFTQATNRLVLHAGCQGQVVSTSEGMACTKCWRPITDRLELINPKVPYVKPPERVIPDEGWVR